MGMFDYYRTSEEIHCPVCSRPLRNWQGKNGPNGLFVWVEMQPHPADQIVDTESRLCDEDMIRLRLPDQFTIYSYDCPDHQPVEAKGRTTDGIGTETAVVPYKSAGDGGSK